MESVVPLRRKRPASMLHTSRLVGCGMIRSCIGSLAMADCSDFTRELAVATNYPLLLILSMTLVSLIAATAIGSLAVRTGFPLPMSDRRIGCVDGLRGYLALAVLAHHFVIWMQVTRFGGEWAPPTVNILNNLGAGGVALFFMTTGLVFYPRILAGFRRTSWVATYITRAFRIVPLVAVSVVIVTIIIEIRICARPKIGYIKNYLEWITAWAQPPLLDYPDSGRLDAYVLWSLWFEWVFYLLVLPACALAMDVLRGRVPSWIVPVALLIVSLAARQTHIMRNLPQYLPLFAIGMLGYEAQQRAWLRRLLQTSAAAVFACIALVFGLITAPIPYGVPQMAALGFFFAAVACGNGFAGVLRTRGALALGECSYGIYLLHGILLSLLFVDNSGSISSISANQEFFLMPLVAVAVSTITPLTFITIERPMIRMGSRLARFAIGHYVRPSAPQVEVAP